MPKSSTIALILITLLLLPSLFQSGMVAAQPTASSPTGLIVPLYGQLGPEWEQLIQAKQAHPAVPVVAIVNAASGSGDARNSAYATAIDSLKAVGIVVLGYVSTREGERPIKSLETDIADWRSWYGVDGVYFDQMPQRPGREGYYAYMTQFAKSHGMTVTMGNPGANTSLSYIGTVGTIVISERVGVPSLSYLAGWDKAGEGKGNFAFIARGVPDYNSTYLEDAAASVGFLFVSDASNYFALPTYLSSEMSSLLSVASGAHVPLNPFLPPRMLVPR
ncbi:MAG TPA: spherulation-specific family 4 protein [Nitrososphaerales archaeon]|nr:spherulation-specific family 4 protein [Nitrososphaerales archaeon]